MLRPVQRPPRIAVALLTAIALTMAFQVPSLAQTYANVDARHDVERFPQHVRAPHNRKADVTHLRIRHRLKAVRFTIRLRSASLKNLSFRIVGFTLKTPDQAFEGDWIAQQGATQYDLADETGEPVRCTESSGRHGQTIWLRLDRTCLGAPRWIRASVRVGANHRALGWGDNAISDNWRSSNGAVSSPRLHAGG
jgi:hypothetical protein